MAKILIAGGWHDQNLHWLQTACERSGIETQSAIVKDGSTPSFHWDVGKSAALLEGKVIDCSAAFIRYDVFSTLMTPDPEAAANASAWYATVSSYCAAMGIFVLNRNIHFSTSSKPAMLLEAAKCGLRVPHTVISNELSAIGSPEQRSTMIAKPVAGGSYVMDMDRAVGLSDWDAGRSPSPAIAQPRLSYPEVRVYRVGDSYFAFDIRSTTTDSRLDSSGSIAGLAIEGELEALVKRIEALTDALSCDFCAIDFKSDARTGELLFLELNNSPMFVGYDRVIGGAMADVMVRYLSENG